MEIWRFFFEFWLLTISKGICFWHLLNLWLSFFLVNNRGRCVDVNKTHDDNNGGGQREKVKRVWEVSRWHCILHPQLWVKSRDMCSRKESNELFSDQEIGKARTLQSEEPRENRSRGFWGRRKWRRRNICEKSRKRVREESGNSREIVKRKGVDVFFGEI